MRKVDCQDGKFILSWEWKDQDMWAIKEAVKSSGGRWNPDAKHWWIKSGQFQATVVGKIADRWNFYLTESAAAVIHPYVKEASANKQASFAGESDFHINGLGDRQPYPYQRAGVAWAIKHRKTVLGDDMGLGKTGQAIMSLVQLNAFPAIVVCPASVKINWQREVELWNPGRSVEVLNGKAEYSNADITIINYDLLIVRANAPSKHGEYIKGRRWEAVVLDEAQYIKNPKSKRTQAVMELSQGVGIKLALTGTAIMNRPIELVPILDWMGALGEFGGQFAFAKRYCGAKLKQAGLKMVWDYSGASNTIELNERLRAMGLYLRRVKRDVLKDLPPKSRHIVPVEIDNREEYRRQEQEFIDLIDEQGTENGEHLQRIEALRQTVAKGKLAAAWEFIDNLLEL